ncbi:MAG: MucBP domain-containing protein [Clostridia bacterium]|nr:MucBP domain-containing protein [Clostridia bacterium]
MKENQKRSISILTVFLWLAFIIIMSIITITGINKKNELDELEKKMITIQIDFTDFFENETIIDEDIKDAIMQNEFCPAVVKDKNIIGNSDIMNVATLIKREGNVGIYEIEIDQNGKYIAYYPTAEIPCSLSSNTNHIEIINLEYEEEKIYLYGQEIKEEQVLYEVRLEPLQTTKINIKSKGEIESKFQLQMIQNGAYMPIHCIENSDNEMVYEIYYIPYMTFNVVFDTDKRVKENGELLAIVDGKYTKIVNTDNIQEEYQFALVEDIPEVYNSVKWIDFNTKEAQIEFQYNSTIYLNKDKNDYDLNTYYTIYYLLDNDSSIKHPNYIVFKEVLSDNFTIADEYLNNEEWKILEDVSDEEANDIIYLNSGFCTKNMPAEVIKSFIVNYDETWLLTEKEIEYTNIKYVYVKSTNTVYCIENDVKESGNHKFNIKYVGKNSLDLKEQKLKVSEEIEVIGIGSWSGCGVNNYYEDRYILDNNYLKYENDLDTKVQVNKLVKGETGKNTYYVGLFEDEIDNTASKIYHIDTIDGVGSIDIEIVDYDERKNYYIYEVDKNGNKIIDSKLEYSKNKVLENANMVLETKIMSLKDVVSVVATDAKKIDDIVLENSITISPEKYLDNTIVGRKIYEDIMTITSNYEEKVHLVKYVAKAGGKLDGVNEEIVKHGEVPSNVPSVISNENYEFDKWIVIKNGIEMKEEPSKYIVEEDTVFYALFKKTPARVIVKYIDEEENEIIPSEEINGYVGDSYSTEKKEIEGYKIIAIPSNKVGTMKEKEIEVIYVYSKILVDTSDINIGKYIIISLIAIIGVIVGLIIIKKNKRKMN